MDFCYLDRISTPNGMFVFIILVIHRETCGISQLGLSYQINEENTPNIRYLANYLKNIHTINLILNDFTMGLYFVQYIHKLLKKYEIKILSSAARARQLGWGFHTTPIRSR